MARIDLSLLLIRCRLMSTLLVLAGLSAPAFAAPDAGTLQQQIDRERGITLPKKSTPTEVAPQPIKSIGGQTITVKAFVFSGNTLLTNEQLSLVVAHYLDHALTFTELQQAAASIAATYREAGWVVRAYLPEQDVNDGNITIQIVEAVFGGVKLEGNPPARVKEAKLLSIISSAQSQGQTLNANKLDRAILLLDDMPGVAVSGSLQKGETDNATDLILKTADEPLMNGEVTTDNSGSRSTGSERINGNFYLNSPLGFGDQATANVIHSQGNDYGRLGYTMPVGNNGLRIGASGSYLSYDLVSDNFKGLNAKGTSSTLGLEANYPLIRSRMKNLYLGLNVDRKNFDNEASLATTTHYAVNDVSLSLNGNLFDKLGGGGANAAGITLTQGNMRLGALNVSEDASLEGGFTKLNYHLSRQQAITDSLSFYGAVSGQVASTNLDSSEKFYLGGANGIRAYPTSEGGGADGQMLNLELRSRLPNNFNLTGFYDLGHVKVNHNNDALLDPNNITLKGAGVTLAWQSSFGLNLKATWAHRIGNNPNPTSTGKDQDGTLQQNRIWLNAAMTF